MNPGDFSTILMSLSVVAYGAYQYFSREQAHRNLLQTIGNRELIRSSAPAGRARPAVWRLVALVLGESLIIAWPYFWFQSVPSIPMAGGRELISAVSTIYLMLALPGVLGLLKPALWRLMTLWFIELALVAAVVCLLYNKTRIGLDEATYIISFIFSILFLVLLPIVVRDTRAYRNR